MKKQQSFDVIRSLNTSLWDNRILTDQLVFSKVRINRLMEKNYELTPKEEWKELDQDEDIIRYKQHLIELDADIYYAKEFIWSIKMEKRQFTQQLG